MAELADAQASGACGSNLMRVQVPFPALRITVEVDSSAVFLYTQMIQNLGQKQYIRMCTDLDSCYN